MSESKQNLVSLIPTWVATTQNVDIPEQAHEEELDRCVFELRRRLRDGTWDDSKLDSDDEGLAVLSRFCFELSKPFSVGDFAMREATAAYELVSGLTWPADLFGERNEILSQLALVAWRYSRQFGTTEVMLEWEKRYRAAFSCPSTESECLEQFLATQASERPDKLTDALFSDLRALYGVCELLRVGRDARPAKVATEAAFFYKWIAERGHVASDSDRNYLLGTTALIAGTSHRFLGQRESSAKWFEKAESFFSTLRNAEPELANLAYGWLTLCYERRQYALVLRDIPVLLARFQTLELEEGEVKCLYLQGTALKESGSPQEALAKLLALEKRLLKADSCRLLGAVVSKIGELFSALGWHHEAMLQYQRALPLLRKSGRPSMLADLKGTAGETCRDMGQFASAIDLYRDAISDYCDMSMGATAAYVRIVLAETLLLAGRPVEAGIEILAALPTIENERMVEEEFAALSLLRESVNGSEPDAASLRELRDRLKRGAQ